MSEKRTRAVAQAFPMDYAQVAQYAEGGMSIREYAAIQIMAGMEACERYDCKDGDYSYDAEQAVLRADALIKALEEATT